jgi:hypothetical protein
MKLTAGKLKNLSELKPPIALLKKDWKEKVEDVVYGERPEKLTQEEVQAVINWWNIRKNTPVPDLLGREFSFGLLSKLLSLFLRYAAEKYLKEREEKTEYAEKFEKMLYRYFFGEDSVWEYRLYSEPYRTLIMFNPAHGHVKENKIAVIPALLALIDAENPSLFSPEGKEELRNFISAWLKKFVKAKEEESNFSLPDAEEVYKLYASIVPEFLQFLKENFPVTVKRGMLVVSTSRLKKTLLGTMIKEAKWISKEDREKLNLMHSDDELFPLLKEESNKEKR